MYINVLEMDTETNVKLVKPWTIGFDCWSKKKGKEKKLYTDVKYQNNYQITVKYQNKC
jgi:hypothetical protein